MNRNYFRKPGWDGAFFWLVLLLVLPGETIAGQFADYGVEAAFLREGEPLLPIGEDFGIGRDSGESGADFFAGGEPVTAQSAVLPQGDGISRLPETRRTLQRKTLELAQEAGTLRMELAQSQRELADMYAHAEEYSRALESYRSAIIYAPRNEENYYYVGMVAALLEDRRSARHYLNRYLEMAPQGRFVSTVREILRLIAE